MPETILHDLCKGFGALLSRAKVRFASSGNDGKEEAVHRLLLLLLLLEHALTLLCFSSSCRVSYILRIYTFIYIHIYIGPFLS